MKKLSITKEAFERSRYFTEKYGRLEYVSESGRLFKTNKGKVLMFKEYVDSGSTPPKSRSDGACDNLKPGEYGLSKEWVEGIGTRYVIYKGGIEPGQMLAIKSFGARQKDKAEEVLMGLQDGSIQEKNLSYVREASKKFKEGTESNPRFKCMEDVGTTTSTGGRYATFLTDMVAGFLEKQRGIDDVEHGDDGILVTFSDGGKVVVSFETI